MAEEYYGVSEFWKPRSKPIRIKIIEFNGNKLKFEAEGQTHTLFDPLRMVLMEDESVIFVAYRILHPLTEKVLFVLETRDKDPIQVIKEGLKKLRNKLNEFKKYLLKAADQKAKAPFFIPEKEWEKFVKENL